MKCDNCGAELGDNAKFCKKCGNPVSDAKEVKSKKSRLSPLIIIIVLIIICLVAVGGVFAYIVYFDTSDVEIMQLTDTNHGNVLANSEISSNIIDSNISSEICTAAESGVPVYKIGDGSGPVTVITAGVHGDQLVPTIAAMDLINYLDGRKINGTVYVIPFTSPQAIQDNVKLTGGVNLNKVADEQGTVTNDVVNFAISNNASAVGDFHETEIGKNPGKTTIMCSQYPTPGSYELANSMSLLSLDTTMTFTVAGVAYDGAVEDVLNLNGVPAVTPLVLVSNHGEVNPSAVSESYDQMLALLYVNGNLNPDDDYMKLANADIDGFDF